jgi:hypothetical protein
MLGVYKCLTNGPFSLSVVDDTAREDFSPRQRHTLKEFAVCSQTLLVLGLHLVQPAVGHCHARNGALA